MDVWIFFGIVLDFKIEYACEIHLKIFGSKTLSFSMKIVERWTAILNSPLHMKFNCQLGEEETFFKFSSPPKKFDFEVDYNILTSFCFGSTYNWICTKGPRDLGTYKYSEWLLEKLAISFSFSFGFIKKWLKRWFLQLGIGNQRVLFLLMLSNVTLHLQIIS